MLKAYPSLSNAHLSAEAIQNAASECLMAAKNNLQYFCEADRSSWHLQDLVERYDTLFLGASRLYGHIYLLANTHTEEPIRQMAYQVMPDFSAFFNTLSTNETLFERFQNISEGSDREASPEHLKSWQESIKNFKKNGLGLPPEERKELEALKNELVKLTMTFQKNINADNRTLTFSEEDLIGLPDYFLEKYKIEDKNYSLPVLDTAYRPVIEYAIKDATRHKFYMAYLNKAADTNKKLLDEIIQKRQVLAKKLGFDTYASYVLMDRMAQKSQTVFDFEERVYQKVRLKAAIDYLKLIFVKYGAALAEVLINPGHEAEGQNLEPKSPQEFEKQLYELLSKLTKALPIASFLLRALQNPNSLTSSETDTLFQFFKHFAKQKAGLKSWETAYLNRLLMENIYAVNQEELKPYFELSNVLEGVFGAAQKLFGVRFVPAIEIPTWHKEVTVYKVLEAEKLLGYLYLDLFPRPSKYSHFACFGYKTGKEGALERIVPHTALVCNFESPTDTRPSLLTHDHVETVFHEFGHALHSLLSKAALNGHFGTSVTRDFVEVPSQWFEGWAWHYDSLKCFARHYQTGEILPKDIFERMVAAKSVNSGLANLAQIIYGLYDMHLHAGFEPQYEGHSVAHFGAIQERYGINPPVEGTNMGAGFGHLMGYGAGYYGYLWARVYAEDCLALFEEKGIFEADLGRAWLNEVLSKGGSSDELSQIRCFLKREPNENAFFKSIGL